MKENWLRSEKEFGSARVDYAYFSMLIFNQKKLNFRKKKPQQPMPEIILKVKETS